MAHDLIPKLVKTSLNPETQDRLRLVDNETENDFQKNLLSCLCHFHATCEILINLI